MLRKSLPITLTDAAESGEFRATFATLNVIDHDGDVIVPGAFTEGQPVRIAGWGYNWGGLPVGKGAIHSDSQRAWVDGQFFLDTAIGADTYRTVKNLGDLGEWSFGFDVLERSERDYQGQSGVQFLERLDVFEVSPVLLGAGIDTHTDYIKGAKTPLTDEEIIEVLKGDSTRLEAIIKALGVREPQPVATLSVGAALAQLRLAEYAAATIGG